MGGDTGEAGDASRGRGPYRGPDDVALRARWQQERRAVARAHHPDRGGDAHELHRGLAAVDADHQALDTARPHQQPLRRAVRDARRRLLRLRRAGQAAIPRGWPGRRRYIDL